MMIPPTRVFKDDALDDFFRREGYVVTPLLSPDEVEQLVKAHDELIPDIPGDFYVTMFTLNPDFRRAVSKAIDDVIQPAALALFDNYKTVISSFISKRGSSKQGVMPIHQDFSFVDQDRFTGVHAWIPLIDVDEHNGCLSVYPGSHSLINHTSALSCIEGEYHPSPYDSVRQILTEKCAVSVPMKAGTAMFFNERTLHSSEENITPQNRIAASSAYIPSGESLRVYRRNQDGDDTLDILTVAEATQVHMHMGYVIQKPYTGVLQQIGKKPYKIEYLCPEDLLPLYREHRKSS